MKIKANNPVWAEPLAFNLWAWCLAADRRVDAIGREFDPPQVHHFGYAPSVVRATSGAILRREPKDRVGIPTVIVALRLEESKGENDLPQLRNRNGESRKVREESYSAIPLQEVWKAIQ
jgi:hypothetical protein